VPPLATALGPDEFAGLGAILLPAVAAYADPRWHVGLRTSALACLAETAEAMGAGVGPFAAELVGALALSLADDEEEVNTTSPHSDFPLPTPSPLPLTDCVCSWSPLC
jgi:hypothetical protein